MLEKIEKALDEFVRPTIHSHRGEIEISHFSEEDGTLYVQLLGECSGCPSAMDTTENLVAAEVMREVPEVKKVVLDQCVSDEAYELALHLLGHNI